jgi:glyceraldehyde-3-phosphate dehydrogenase/erythrose-4-phosphate dehydrogenase
MTGRVAINGLGRIGRAALKLALQQPDLELVAVNEIGSIENMAYLLKHDTVYGRYERPVEAVDGKRLVDGRPLVYMSRHHLLRKLHNEQHHAAGGDPRPPLRHREGRADHGPRVYGNANARR